MMIWKGLCILTLFGAISAEAHGQQQGRGQIQGPQVVRILEGYTCMALNVQRGRTSWDDLPPVYAEPSASAAQIGIATNNVIVAEPRREQNGFIAVLHMDGRPGWLDARMVRQWRNLSDPSTQCHPAMMSNGRPGFTYTRPHG
ncbi:hypothetical protein GXW71_10070 [Roseomonas hellenica]|uniref:Uncharacterized protein n=1 Tax=Plastoroseomonas hellenica TaxID=2687306 RepID=A0ABS5EWL6_9PROT|nr:hypothetical protein [Plastoroseomonas hellenica]MBR0664697.1 hypothetical protein [Plastoroseomonas hellenica]